MDPGTFTNQDDSWISCFFFRGSKNLSSNCQPRLHPGIRAAMRDEREDDLSLDEALSAGEADKPLPGFIGAGPVENVAVDGFFSFSYIFTRF